MGVFARPRTSTGWRSWVTTVDHKKIGIMYGAAALFFFVIGGVEALLIRLQLATPNGKLLSADLYNQVYTMHGTTMIFLVVMPIGAAFMNYLVPLQIGARDVAFPRLNALRLLVLPLRWHPAQQQLAARHAPDNGWFNYAPNSGVIYSPTHGIDFWNMGLIITGIASLTGAINLITTCLNMRAPGMTLMKMPVFTWMALVTQFLLLFAIPVLTAAQFLLMFDRLFGANFFNVDQGADPLLWEHLFWIFGHPEVYIMILPAFGVVSEIIPVFARKPIFGYPFMVFSGIAIGFMGWGVWAHHMFASGIGPISVAAFSMSTMFIAVPTGVKILNWMATMWGGKLKFTRPDAVLDRPGHDVHHRRPLGRDPRRRPGRHPADRHLLHRRPLPLRPVRWRPLRLHGRLLLLVAEGVRLQAERDDRQVELLDAAAGLQPHVRPDAHPRPPGHAPPHLHLPGRLRLQLLEHGQHDRCVHHRRRRC